MKASLIINEAAGGALATDVKALADAVAQIFAAHGWDVTSAVVAPDAIEAALMGAAQAKPDMVLVGGGDGTIQTAAAALMNTDTALAILPLGTLNRLARDLDIPLDPLTAAAALAQSPLAKIDVAKVNGEVFLCQSMLGLPPKFARDRQAWRGAPLIERLRRMWQTLRTFLRTRHRISLTLDDGSKVRRLRALSLIVANNPFSEAADAQLRRPTLSGGTLGIYISRHRNGFALMMATLRVFLGQHRSDADLEILRVKRMTVGSGQDYLRLSNDGEVVKFAPPLVYEICPQALTVVAPATVALEIAPDRAQIGVPRQAANSADLEALAKARSL